MKVKSVTHDYSEIGNNVCCVLNNIKKDWVFLLQRSDVFLCTVTAVSLKQKNNCTDLDV